MHQKHPGGKTRINTELRDNFGDLGGSPRTGRMGPFAGLTETDTLRLPKGQWRWLAVDRSAWPNRVRQQEVKPGTAGTTKELP
jgi:hypothetical protein